MKPASWPIGIESCSIIFPRACSPELIAISAWERKKRGGERSGGMSPAADEENAAVAVGARKSCIELCLLRS